MVNIASAVPRSTLRGISEGAMTSTLTITRTVLQLDENGEVLKDRYGQPYPAEPETTTTKCRLKDLSGDEQIIAGRLSPTASGTLVCPQGTPLTADMTVTVDGDSYNVAYVKQKSEALSVHTEVLISRSQG